MRSFYMTPEWQSVKAQKQKILSIVSLQLSSIKVGTACCGKYAGTLAPSMLAGGALLLMGEARLLGDGAFLGRVILIPCRGRFMCHSVIAGLGFRYLRIRFLDKLGTPFEEPFAHHLQQCGDFWVAQQLVCKFHPICACTHRVCEGHKGDTRI